MAINKFCVTYPMFPNAERGGTASSFACRTFSLKKKDPSALKLTEKYLVVWEKIASPILCSPMPNAVGLPLPLLVGHLA
jgi:hypothetical protein